MSAEYAPKARFLGVLPADDWSGAESLFREEVAADSAHFKDVHLKEDLDAHSRRIAGREFTVVDRFPFRNQSVAELATSIDTLEGIDRLEKLLEEQGCLSIPLRSLSASRGTKTLTLVGASENGSGFMKENFWIRDQSQYVMAMMDVWETDKETYQDEGANGKQVLLSLLHTMSTPAQLARFDGVIRHADDEAYIANPIHWPHIFFAADNLDVEKDQNWSHKQDAWQMLAYATFEGLEKGLISVDELTDQNKQFLSSVVPFLYAVRFWERPNSGSWEEIEAVRSSVIAWDVSLLDKIAEFAAKKGFEFLQEGYEKYLDTYSNEDRNSTIGQFATALSHRGKSILARGIPYESPFYEEFDPRHRQMDMAIGYLLELTIPQVLGEITVGEGTISDASATAETTETLILSMIEGLADERTRGVRRYIHDSYQAADFWTHRVMDELRKLYSDATANSDFSKAAHFVGRNEIVGEGPEAAWTHPNFQISVWAGKRYRETGDEKYKLLQKEYLMRGLSMVTGEKEYTLVHDGKGIHVEELPAYRVPECYITISTSDGDMILPGPFTPLNWGVALLHKALVGMRETIKMSM